MTDNEKELNGKELRELIEASGLTQTEALDMFNAGQARKLSLGHWKSYLSAPGTSRWTACPDEVVTQARQLYLGRGKTLAVSVRSKKVGERQYQVNLKVEGITSQKRADGLVEQLTRLLAPQTKG